MNIALLAVVMLAVTIPLAFIGIYSIQPHTQPTSIGYGGCDNYDAKSFFKCGGKSWLSIKPYNNEVNATIGSWNLIPINITHVASAYPLTSVLVKYTGLEANYIQECDSKFTPTITSKIFNPNSTDSRPKDEFFLIAGESKTIVLNVTIPQEWPSCATMPILYHIGFVDLFKDNVKDFLMDNSVISIRVTGNDSQKS